MFSVTWSLRMTEHRVRGKQVESLSVVVLQAWRGLQTEKKIIEGILERKYKKRGDFDQDERRWRERRDGRNAAVKQYLQNQR